MREKLLSRVRQQCVSAASVTSQRIGVDMYMHSELANCVRFPRLLSEPIPDLTHDCALPSLFPVYCVIVIDSTVI